MTLGIIGGMGPEATINLCERIIAHTQAASDQEHIDMVILNHTTMPDRTKAILTNTPQPLLEHMKKCADILNYAAVDVVAMPCNTSHYFYKDVQSFLNMPLINMPLIAIKKAISQFPGLHKLGIIATNGTVRSGLYTKPCESEGIEPIYPDSEYQDRVMSLIYDDIKARGYVNVECFKDICEHLRARGAQALLLACTEISLIQNEMPLPSDGIDALDALAYECIVRSGKNYK